MPDSGFFPNYNSPFTSRGMKDIQRRVGGPKYQHVDGLWYSDENDLKTQKNIYGNLMKNVFDMVGIGNPLQETVDESLDSVIRCSKEMSSNSNSNSNASSLCIFPENLLKYITTPLFIVQVIDNMILYYFHHSYN